MFIDASAIVAILAEEDDADMLLRRLDVSPTPRYVSPPAVFEAVAALARIASKHSGGRVSAKLIAQAQAAVTAFVESVEAKEVMISADIGRKAVAAMMEHGKLVGAPAQLNFGDCFAYACAKAYRVPLLYKGDDFSHTDLA